MNVQQKIHDLRTQRAAEWLQIMQEGDKGSHAEFVRWITESPLNLEEFLKIQALSQETQAVLNSVDFDREALLKQAAPNVLSFAHAMPAAVPPSGRKRRRIRTWIGSTAATAAIVALAAFWIHQHFSWTHYSTNAEQKRTVRLTDGSVVYMNSGSSLAVRLNSAARDLRLSRGEALFDVAQDPHRPFRVNAQHAVVEALGTQFNVRLRDDEIRVAVIEGKVRISRDSEKSVTSEESSAPIEAQAALTAGEAVRITPAGQIEHDTTTDVIAAVAWSQPELVFTETPLEEAVRQFNRYRRGKRLRLEGLQAGTHHYSGIFDATDVESFAELLSREPDLEVAVFPDEIVIQAR